MFTPLPSVPFYHDGEADFLHGAGASEPGWYYYDHAEAAEWDGDTSAHSIDAYGPFTEAEAAAFQTCPIGKPT